MSYMQNEKIICSECGAENGAEYEYCKNCGAALRQNETQQYNAYNYNSYNTYNNTQGGYYQSFDGYGGGNAYTAGVMNSIGGVSRDELETFIGKKADVILPKFEKMEQKGSNTSWCWAVSVLCFFMGALGASLWFFYRKLYKPAFIFLAIGILFNAITQPLAYKYEQMFEQKYVNRIVEIFDTAETSVDEKALEGLLNDFINESATQSYIAVFLIRLLIEAVVLITASLLAFGIYKKHTIRSILEYRSSNVDPRYYRMGLVSLGGTSSGMVVLAFAIQFIASYVISTVVGLFL